MTNYDDFIIENDVLTKYTGKDTEITIPDGIVNIGDDAFRGCNALEGVILPNSVNYIGFQAFSYCENLQHITSPESVISIGDLAFLGCSNLVIYAPSSSYAETYAMNNQIKFEAISDETK